MKYLVADTWDCYISLGYEFVSLRGQISSLGGHCDFIGNAYYYQ